jgi:hypothetical protein
MSATDPVHWEKMREVIRIGMEMRGAQRKYFRTRDRNDLLLSKQLEQQYDAAAARLFGAPSKPEPTKPQGALL